MPPRSTNTAKKIAFDSIIELLEAFSDQKVCLDYLSWIRWKGKPRCPKCNSKEKPYVLGDHEYKCSNNECGLKFNVLKGTIFENTKLPLQNWFAAIYFSANHTYGINASQLARDLGMTVKSAWFMLQRIRECYRQSYIPLLEGVVEVDEIYIGGKVPNQSRQKKKKWKGKGRQGRSKYKTPILGIVQRNGMVYAQVVADTTAKVIAKVIRRHVAKGTLVITDSYGSYNWLTKTEEYHHVKINHSKGEFHYQNYHTNTIEGFWGLLRKGLAGTYHQVIKKHLYAYVNEFTYRYNHRHLSNQERLNDVLLKGCQQRMTFHALMHRGNLRQLYAAAVDTPAIAA